MAANQSAHEVLHAITKWALARDSIRAVLLTSTRAIPNGYVDALSDYDVILIVEDIHPFADDRAWISDFGAVLVVYWDPIQPDPDVGIDYIANVTQYADGLKIDFTLWSVALFQRIVAAATPQAELDAGYQVLLDKDHLTDALHPPSARAYIPARPTDTEFQIWVNDFWSDPPYVAKCLWRDELLPAKWCLDADMQHKYLRQMLEWRIQIDHGWSIPVGALGKGLKKHLPPEIWALLETCFAGAGLAENWLALEHTIALFRQVAIEVGAYLGYTYPHDLDQRVTDYVEQIKRMEPPSGTPPAIPPTPAAARDAARVVLASKYLEKQEALHGCMLIYYSIVGIGALLTTITSVVLQLRGQTGALASFALIANIGLWIWLAGLARRRNRTWRNYRAGRAGEDRTAEQLRTALDDRWTIYRNLQLPDRTDDLDLVLVGPGGVWAVQVKATRAPLRVQAGRWQVRRGGLWVAAKPNPGTQITHQATALNHFFKCNGLTRFVERAVALAEPQPFDRFTASEIPVWLPFDIAHRAQALATRHPPPIAELARINALLGQRAAEQRAGERVGKRRYTLRG